MGDGGVSELGASRGRNKVLHVGSEGASMRTERSAAICVFPRHLRSPWAGAAKPMTRRSEAYGPAHQSLPATKIINVDTHALRTNCMAELAVRVM